MKAKEEYAERFVGITPRGYEELEDRHKKVLKIFSKYKFDRILDVGCGDGSFSVLLKEACEAKEVYGIEISEKGVESARKNGVKAFQLDIDEKDFPFGDNYFDAVFAGEVIEHLFDTDHFLDEVYRVLKAEGIFVLTTPNLASIYNRIMLLLGYYPLPINVSLRHFVGHLFNPWKNCRFRDEDGREIAPSATHIRAFTPLSLRELMKLHGFVETRIECVPAALPDGIAFSPLLRFIDSFFSVFPSLGYKIVLKAKKKEN